MACCAAQCSSIASADSAVVGRVQCISLLRSVRLSSTAVHAVQCIMLGELSRSTAKLPKSRSCLQLDEVWIEAVPQGPDVQCAPAAVQPAVCAGFEEQGGLQNGCILCVTD